MSLVFELNTRPRWLSLLLLTRLTVWPTLTMFHYWPKYLWFAKKPKPLLWLVCFRLKSNVQIKKTHWLLRLNLNANWNRISNNARRIFQVDVLIIFPWQEDISTMERLISWYFFSFGEKKITTMCTCNQLSLNCHPSFAQLCRIPRTRRGIDVIICVIRDKSTKLLVRQDVVALQSPAG